MSTDLDFALSKAQRVTLCTDIIETLAFKRKGRTVVEIMTAPGPPANPLAVCSMLLSWLLRTLALSYSF